MAGVWKEIKENLKPIIDPAEAVYSYLKSKLPPRSPETTTFSYLKNNWKIFAVTGVASVALPYLITSAPSFIVGGLYSAGVIAGSITGSIAGSFAALTTAILGPYGTKCLYSKLVDSKPFSQTLKDDFQTIKSLAGTPAFALAGAIGLNLCLAPLMAGIGTFATVVVMGTAAAAGGLAGAAAYNTKDEILAFANDKVSKLLNTGLKNYASEKFKNIAISGGSILGLGATATLCSLIPGMPSVGIAAISLTTGYATKKFIERKINKNPIESLKMPEPLKDAFTQIDKVGLAATGAIVGAAAVIPFAALLGTVGLAPAGPILYMLPAIAGAATSYSIYGDRLEKHKKDFYNPSLFTLGAIGASLIGAPVAASTIAFGSFIGYAHQAFKLHQRPKAADVVSADLADPSPRPSLEPARSRHHVLTLEEERAESKGSNRSREP
jgi:hypothetical protein